MKNFVFISPNFPMTYWKFCRELKNNGMRVLGIGDSPYDDLLQELREALLLGLNGLRLGLLGNGRCLRRLGFCLAAGRQQEQDQPREQDDENIFVLGRERAEFSCVHDVLLHSCRARGIPRSASMICARRLFSAAGPDVIRRTDCGYQ